MARLNRNLANKTDNFKEVDEQYAYAIWIIEKEFNVGPITGEFLAMKFWNLLDDENMKRYKNQTKTKGSSKGIGTFR